MAEKSSQSRLVGFVPAGRPLLLAQSKSPRPSPLSVCLLESLPAVCLAPSPSSSSLPVSAVSWAPAGFLSCSSWSLGTWGGSPWGLEDRVAAVGERDLSCPFPFSASLATGPVGWQSMPWPHSRPEESVFLCHGREQALGNIPVQ